MSKSEIEEMLSTLTYEEKLKLYEQLSCLERMQ